METRTDGQNPFSKEYAVCISQEGDLVGSVTGLMDLSQKCEKGSTAPPSENENSAGQASLGVQVPSSFGWTNHNGHNWMTSVKDQGKCGSCWAFSAVGVVEAVYNIRYDDPGLDLDLSEQYLVSDCLSGVSCCGGWSSIALSYFFNEGVPDEGCMPYVDGGCTCGDGDCDANCNYRTGDSCSDRTCSDRCADWQSRLVKIDRWGFVSDNPQTIKEYIIGKGPVSAAMGTGDDYGGHFGDFPSHNIYRCTNDSGANHEVVVVGYNDIGGVWIVKNSWGTDWGEGGYFLVGYGECNIENNVRYADKVDCGCTVASNTTVTRDLVNCPGDGLTIDADGIELSCLGSSIHGDSSSGAGIKIDGKSNVTIRNCNVKGFNFGIYVNDSHGNRLWFNSADSNHYGFYLTGADSNSLFSNSADSNYYGFVLSGGDSNGLMNNSADSNYVGFYLSGADSSTLTGNTANNNKAYGIGVTSNSSGNILTDNITNNNEGSGILFGGQNNVLTNHTANSNSGYGILLDGRNDTLSNNTADSNYYGMYIYSDSNIVENNTLNYNIFGMPLVGCSNNIIKNNTVNYNSTGFLMTESSNNELTDNIANWNEVGIYFINHSNNNYIMRNDFIDNTEYGAYLDDSVRYNIFWGNEFTNNGTNNAYEDSTSSDNDWNLADTGNYWSDCCANPGYPDQYEIPGPGDGVDYYPEWPSNCAPCPFSLLSPEDSAFVSTHAAFDWEDGADYDAGDTVRYDLLVSTSLEFHPDSTIIHDSLLTSNYADTLDIGVYYWKVKAYDVWGAETWSAQPWAFGVFLRGDANADGETTISDVVFLINYLFKSGPAPEPVESGDANCDGEVTISDAVYLINYLFKSGPPPC